MRKALVAIVLLLAPLLMAQADKGVKAIQIQQAGTPVMTRAGGMVRMNCLATFICTFNAATNAVDIGVASGSTTFASGGLTLNQLPKSNGAGQLIDSIALSEAYPVFTVNETQTLNGTLTNLGGATLTQLTAPTTPAVVQLGTTGGFLLHNQAYFYKITATDGNGGQTGVSAEVTFTTGAIPAPDTYSAFVTWDAMPGASGYKVYRGTTTGTELLLATISAGNTNSYTDNTNGVPAGAMPTVNTTSQVLAVSGGVSAPGFGFAAHKNTGLWDSTGALVGASVGVNIWRNTTTQFGINNAVTLCFSGGDPTSVACDLFLTRSAAATLQLGVADVNGTPVNQNLRSQGAVTGTNLPGGSLSISGGPGTGTGAGQQLTLQRPLMLGTGATQQSLAHAVVVCESKTLSNTSATAQSVIVVNLASNSAGGAFGTFTVTATDGTNFDSETQSWNVSYVNKATTLTIGTPNITASTAASNSGSATIGMTAVAGTNQVLIKVTPVFTTIVPTLVTWYGEINSHGAGAVVCQ